MRAYLADVRKVVSRRTLTALLLMSLFITALEAASISAVIPAVGVILGDGLPPQVAAAMGRIGLESASTQVLALTFFVAVVFLLRGVLLSAATYLQSKLVFSTQQGLSSELFTQYMSARFESVTDVASSTLVRTSTTELANVTLGVLLPMAALASEAALIVGCLLVLLTVQPGAAVTLLVAALALSAPIFWLNRRRLSRLGQTRHDMEDDRVRLAQELVGGVREIKVYDLKAQLEDVIARTNASYSQVMTRINFLQNFPRIYFETLGVCALLVTCAIQLSLGRSSREVVMFLTVSAFAAFRALPSVAKLLAQLQALRFYRPSLTSYLDLMARLAPTEARPEAAVDDPQRQCDVPARQVRIIANGASYRHAEDGPWIFDNVNLDLGSGEIVGLTGPSGVGKSTLLDCLIGLRVVTCGDLRVLDAETGAPVRCRIAYVPQTPVMLDGTIGRNITLRPKGSTEPAASDELIVEALRISGLDVVMQGRGLSLNSRVVEGGRNLSGGQRQRLALARALYRQADILILDEATSALDAQAERRVFDSLRAAGSRQLVIMVTHRTELLSYCDATIDLQTGSTVRVTRRSQSSREPAAPHGVEL